MSVGQLEMGVMLAAGQRLLLCVAAQREILAELNSWLVSCHENVLTCALLSYVL